MEIRIRHDHKLVKNIGRVQGPPKPLDFQLLSTLKQKMCIQCNELHVHTHTPANKERRQKHYVYKQKISTPKILITSSKLQQTYMYLGNLQLFIFCFSWFTYTEFNTTKCDSILTFLYFLIYFWKQYMYNTVYSYMYCILFESLFWATRISIMLTRKIHVDIHVQLSILMLALLRTPSHALWCQTVDNICRSLFSRHSCTQFDQALNHLKWTLE